MNLVFIVGTGRCGSSFVHEILAKHKDVGFVSNIDDNIPMLNLKGRWNSAIYRSPLGSFTKKGKLRFAPSEAYKLISRKVSPAYARSCRDLLPEDVTPVLERDFKNFFKGRNTAQDKQVFTHKYTGWSRMGFFSKIFPDAKFIHIVRDGRAVSSSWLRMQWWGGFGGPENWLWGKLPEKYDNEWIASGRSFVRLAGIGWKLMLDSYESSMQGLPGDKYHQIRYEDFLEEPEECIRKILSICELEWSSDFKNSFEKHEIVNDARNSFERDLTSDQLLELTDCLKHRLAKYGYT